MSSDKNGKRREIEDTTAARLAEIVAAAERAAKGVIDEAEAEARARLTDAREEADRIVADRLAALAEITAEIDARAEELKRGSAELQRALAEVRAEFGAPEALGGSSAMGGREAPPAARRPSSPSLTVVGGEPVEPVIREARAAEASEVAPDFDGDGAPAAEIGGGSPAGARLLATQMAVSGSTREEIEARLRHGFAIDDTRPILDAILGPEQ
jgi:vacuolar-type H+-ATPase subunit H